MQPLYLSQHLYLSETESSVNDYADTRKRNAKAAPQEEKLPENSERPAQKLLLFLQEKADFHQSRINTINEKIAVRSDKIARNKAK